MSRQYGNFVRKLGDYDINVVTSLEDFCEDKCENKYPSLTLECTEGHQFSMKIPSLSNKLYKAKNENLQNLCAECDKPLVCGEEVSSREKCDAFGFEFISYTKKTRYVEYMCVCGNISKTHAGNLLRDCRRAECPKCQNIKFRTSQKVVSDYFKKQGCELLSEYTSRHKPVKYRCVCGVIAEIRYSDFKRGKNCKYCKPIKFKKTCQEKYGVDNVFQLESIKTKSRKTCMEKYGVEFCMQSPDVFRKAMSTSYHRKKLYESPCGKYQWIVQGYEPYCIADLLEYYHPGDIMAGEGDEVPVCKYVYNGKVRTWYPDIFLYDEEIIIEVKSTWTYTRAAEQIKAKMEFCEYDCELWIYNRKVLVEIISRDAETGEITYLHNAVVLGVPL